MKAKEKSKKENKKSSNSNLLFFFKKALAIIATTVSLHDSYFCLIFLFNYKLDGKKKF